MDEKLKTIVALREARRKGAAWLLDHVNADGSLGDPAEGFHFYRAPWTFTIVGETGAATGICNWIRREMFDRGGQDRRTVPRLRRRVRVPECHP